MTDCWWLIVDCLHTENAEDTEVRKRTVWENVNHRNLNGILTEGCPQADGGGEQVSINDERWMITDFVHTENAEGYGCPQADEGGERKLKRINRELKEMGPQADGGEQVLINDERLLIIDYWWLMTDCWLSSHGKCGGCG